MTTNQINNMPSNIELEQSVIGALLLEKNAFELVESILAPQVFLDNKNRVIYTTILELKEKDQPSDVAIVIEELKRRGRLDTAGGIPYVLELASIVNSTAHIEYHSRLLYDLWVKREALFLGQRIVRQALDPTIVVTDVLADAEDGIKEITENGSLKQGVYTIQEILPDVIGQIGEAQERGDGLKGVTTGYPDVDQLIGGWQEADLVIIAGRPGMGKTALALSFARSLSVDHSIPTLFFSLEMSRASVGMRLLAAESTIPHELLSTGRYNQNDTEKLSKAIGRLENAKILIDDDPDTSIFEIRSKTRRYVREYGVRVVFVDYLQLMNITNFQWRKNREQEVAEISRSLKKLAKELDVTVVALSQLNRSVETRSGEDKRPMLSDLRESGAIEQDADLVCFTYRPEYYGIHFGKDGTDYRGKAEFIVGKQRNGRTGTVVLDFNAPTMRFYPTMYLQNNESFTI